MMSASDHTPPSRPIGTLGNKFTIKSYLWFMMTLTSVITAAIATRFMFDLSAFEQVRMVHFLENHPVATYAHFVFAPLALFIGGFQFLNKTRTSAPAIHRGIGWIYVFSCMTAAVGGFILAVNTQSGIVVAIGFGTLSVTWLYVTLRAVLAAVHRQFTDHKSWMIRSFAITFSSFTFRAVFLGALPAVSGWDFAFCYSIGSLLCWPLNLAIAEIIIRTNSKPQQIMHAT